MRAGGACSEVHQYAGLCGGVQATAAARMASSDCVQWLPRAALSWHDMRAAATHRRHAACAAQGARSLVAAEGVLGLYHGLLPTLLRDVPEIAIQFALYERLRRALAAGRRVEKLRTWEHLILGGISGARGWLAPSHNLSLQA